jgi:hypothetical protein
MRNLLMIVSISVIIFVVITPMQEVKANDFKLSSISLSSGEGPLSSGLFFEANLIKGDDILNISLGERDMYIYYLKTINKYIKVGPCLEYYYNIPVLGAMALTTPFKNLSFFTWSGISAGEPDMKVEPFNWNFMFFYQSLNYSYKRVSASGAMLYYQEWMPIINLQYNQPIIKNFDFFSSVGYKFHGEGRALFKIGFVYKK